MSSSAGNSGRHCYRLGPISSPGEESAKISGDKAWPTVEEPFKAFAGEANRAISVECQHRHR